MKEKLVRIRFDLTDAPNRDDLPDELTGETIWADALGNERFRIRNSPAFANGYADGDIVECELNPYNNWYEVKRLVEHGGNGVLRLYFVDSNSAAALAVIEELRSVGCNFERASRELVLFVVPSDLRVPFSQALNYVKNLGEEIAIGWEVGKEPLRGVPQSIH